MNYLLRASMLTFFSVLAIPEQAASEPSTATDEPSTATERFYLYTDSNEKAFQLFTKPGVFEKISHLRKDAKEDFRNNFSNEQADFGGAAFISHSLRLADDLTIEMNHFDHGADTLIVLGHGYFSTSKRWRYVVSFLKDYDVVTFDYRWHNPGYFRRSHTIFFPMQSRFFDEKSDVVAVVQAAKKIKKYKQVIGLAECYGALPFTMAQAEQEAAGQLLFDKLILDSTFVSLRTFIDGGVRSNLKQWYLNGPVIATWNLFLPDVSITPYIAQIKSTPLLFIHGDSDLLVTVQEVKDEAFNATKAPKALFETPYEHVQTGTDWGIYKFVCDQFIQAASQADFIDRLRATC